MPFHIEHASRIDHVLCHWAQTQPDRKAYTELNATGAESRTLTYSELEVRTRGVAEWILDQEVPTRQAILTYPPGLEFIIGFFGCIRAGIAPAPVHLPKANRSNARLTQIMRSADASMILSTAEGLEWIRPLLEQEPLWPGRSSFLASDLAPLPSERSESRLQAVDSTIAFLQFTSGSTSQPKGVVIPHTSCLHNLEMCRHTSKACPDSVFVSWLPHHHDLGLVAHLLHSLYCGSHCVVMSPTSFLTRPLLWLEAISKYRGNHTGAPNFAYQLCVNRIPAEDRRRLDLSSLDVAINAGEPVNAQTVMDFCEAFSVAGFEPRMFMPAFGMAEATVYITGGDRAAPPVIKPFDAEAMYSQGIAIESSTAGRTKVLVGCGRAILDEHIHIVDPATHAPLGPCRVGEVWVAGNNLMAGYFNNPEATKAAFGRLAGCDVQHLRTGDLGFLDADGELFITGRLKDLIIINGANYYPNDIELAAEEAHPSIRPSCTAAFGLDKGVSETLVIFAELERGAWRKAKADVHAVDDIAGAICKKIAEQFELSVGTIVFLEPWQLPKTSSGKVRRGECRHQFTTGSQPHAITWPRESAPMTIEEKNKMINLEKSLEKLVSTSPLHLKIFSRVSRFLSEHHQIQLADIDIEQSIFFYNVDSLSIINLHGEMENELGVSIPTEAFFRSNTLSGMIDDIAESIIHKDQFRQEVSAVEPLQKDIDAYLERLVPKLRSTPTRDPQRAETALLTGASGFVGVALLKEILEQSPLRVVCMVRAADEAMALTRIRNTSEKYGLLLPGDFERRIEILLGDMTKPRFGLEAGEYLHFARDVDVVYHCAAVDNFYLPYNIMRRTNVVGSIEVLDFALHTSIKPMYYISSCATSLLGASGQDTRETGLLNGYAKSKYVVEQIVMALASQGYQAVNFKLGYLYNLRLQHVDERWSFEEILEAVQKAYEAVEDSIIIEADAFENFLSAIPTIGAFPDLNADFDLTPVEYAAKAIVAASLLPALRQKTSYTFYNPHPMKFSDVSHFFRKSRGLPTIPLKDFLEKYEAYVRATDRKSVKLLRSVVSLDLEKQLNAMFRDVPVDTIGSIMAWCPPCDRRFTHHYVDFATGDGIAASG